MACYHVVFQVRLSEVHLQASSLRLHGVYSVRTQVHEHLVELGRVPHSHHKSQGAIRWASSSMIRILIRAFPGSDELGDALWLGNVSLY